MKRHYVIFALFLLIFAAGLIIFHSNRNRKSTTLNSAINPSSNHQNSVNLYGSTSPTHTPPRTFKLHDFIDYTLPDGWYEDLDYENLSSKNITYADYGVFDTIGIFLVSPDYNYNTLDAVKRGDDGISVSITRFKINDPEKWRNDLVSRSGGKKSYGTGPFEVILTSVDGREAYFYSPENDLAWDYNNPMNFPFIVILNDGYVYRILTAPFDGTGHKEEFDTLIKSIKFK